MVEAVLLGGGGDNMPGIISSILLFVAGAIAYFACPGSVWSWTMDGSTHSVRIDTVGLILMFAGGVTLFLSVAYNFMKITPTEEEYDEVVSKVPGEEPKKAVRKHRRRKY